MQTTKTQTTTGKRMSARAIAAAKTRAYKAEIAQAVALVSEAEALVMYLVASKASAAEHTHAASRSALLARCVYTTAHDRARYMALYGRVI